jgi:hypothetical protein
VIMNEIVAKNASYWVDWNLENWARFQREGGLPKGAPDHASGGAKGFLNMDFDGMCERMDGDLASITGVVVAQLQPIERCALHHVYLEAVYQFRREGLDTVLQRAKRNVEVGLRKRGVWLGE